MKKGPRKSAAGKLLEHTLIGEIDDFCEMENLYAPAESEQSQYGTLSEQKAEEDKTIKLLQSQAQRLLESRKRENVQRKEWLRQIQIFQRYMEVKQEHALSNWMRHSVQWSNIEKAVSKKINRVLNHV